MRRFFWTNGERKKEREKERERERDSLVVA
jgi:hypothetical protein